MYQKRKILIMLSIILILQIVLPVVNIIWKNSFTIVSRAIENDAYNIDTAQDLWNFAAEVNNGNTFEGATVNLTANIDLSCSEDNQWIPIGDYNSNSANVFKGTFDGKKYTISGIYINSNKKYQGLFGFNAGVIKNFDNK